MATTKTKTKQVPLVVTTSHKGVFFGYADAYKPGQTSITMKNVRMCVYWSTNIKGMPGLASSGPDRSCRVSPAAPSVTLNDVTGFFECSLESVANWEKGPWQ